MILRAGLAFGAGAFAFGFVLGTARTLLIAPQLGAGLAVLLELPLMLIFCWWWAGRVVRRHRPAGRDAALAIGLIGLGVILLGEFAVGVGMLGLSPQQWLDAFSGPSAQMGLAGQLLAAAMPLVRARNLPPK